MEELWEAGGRGDVSEEGEGMAGGDREEVNGHGKGIRGTGGRERKVTGAGER